MTTYDDVMTVEDGSDDEFEVVSSIQRLINAGQWALQGSFGRTMMAHIEAGDVLLGHNRAKDYWGNIIPSRHDVQDGTKGSFDYVAARHDLDYAEALAGIDLTPENAG